MNKSEIGARPDYMDRYIGLVPGDDLIEALKALSQFSGSDVKTVLSGIADKAYAPGKWNVKEVVQHVIDTERIMTYRALCISRGEQQSLPGFDDNAYASKADTSHRSLDDLFKEFSIVRTSSMALFSSMTERMLRSEGTANKSPVSVSAIGFMLAGHQLHHLKILEERYFGLL